MVRKRGLVAGGAGFLAARARRSAVAVILQALLVATIAASGCGGGDDGIPLGDLQERTNDAACAREIRCGRYPDQAACRAAYRQDLGQLVASVGAGKVKYDGKAAASCIDQQGAASCDLTAQTSVLPRPQACSDAFQGTVADGGACFNNDECASEYCNRAACTDPLATCCTGICEPRPAGTLPVAIGGDCSAATAVCAEGAFCDTVLDGSMVSRTTCKVKLGLTAPCDSLDGPFSCAAGSICLPGGPGAQTCGVLPAQGEACTDPGGDFACDSSTDFCAEASMTCVPKIAVGGACTSGYGCVPYAACDPTTLTCVAAGLAGAACDPQGSDCLGNLQCVAGACALPASRPTCP